MTHTRWLAALCVSLLVNFMMLVITASMAVGCDVDFLAAVERPLSLILVPVLFLSSWASAALAPKAAWIWALLPLFTSSLGIGFLRLAAMNNECVISPALLPAAAAAAGLAGACTAAALARRRQRR